MSKPTNYCICTCKSCMLLSPNEVQGVQFSNHRTCIIGKQERLNRNISLVSFDAVWWRTSIRRFFERRQSHIYFYENILNVTVCKQLSLKQIFIDDTRHELIYKREAMELLICITGATSTCRCPSWKCQTIFNWVAS